MRPEETTKSFTWSKRHTRHFATRQRASGIFLELVFPTFKRNGGHLPHADLFLRAGNAVQAARTVWQRFENTSSALAKALLSPEIAEALRQIRAASGLVQHADDELARQLEDLDSRWPDVSRMSSPLWRLHTA